METTKKSLTKGALLALAVALAATMLTGLVACGGESAEDVIRKGVTEELESIKNLDQTALDEIMAGAGAANAGLEEYGIDMEEFCRTWLDGFDYSVDNVTVDGENATATVTITCKSLAEGINIFMDKVTALTEDPEAMSKSMDELNQMMGTMLMEGIGEAPVETNTVDLPYVLNGNTWEPGPGFDTALSQAFAGGAL
ncbi:hypothetical protein [Raoultibacter massiliensis]|uniref:hypothetical protein n=1 Tax=Raoultibacter massiliensis TaxID=1852371 RepID=UPI003A90FFD5